MDESGFPVTPWLYRQTQVNNRFAVNVELPIDQQTEGRKKQSFAHVVQKLCLDSDVIPHLLAA